MSLEKVFESYRSWYGESYYDEEFDYPSDPFEKLKPLTAKQFAALVGRHGKLPKVYEDLVCGFGVGQFLMANDGEPVDFTILPPKHIPRVKKDFLGCMDEGQIQRQKNRQRLDATKMIPFLVDRDWNQWALLARQTQKDDRVLLFSHEQERVVFKRQGSLEQYFRKLFANARKLYSPWYTWTGWK